MTDYPLPPTLPTFIDKVGRTGTKNSRLFSHTNKETNTQTPITNSPSPVSLIPTDSTCNSAVRGILSIRQKQNITNVFESTLLQRIPHKQTSTS